MADMALEDAAGNLPNISTPVQNHFKFNIRCKTCNEVHEYVLLLKPKHDPQALSLKHPCPRCNHTKSREYGTHKDGYEIRQCVNCNHSFCIGVSY